MAITEVENIVSSSKHILENTIHFEKQGEYCCSQEWLEQNGKTHRAMIQLGDIIVRATGRNNYAIVNQDLGTVVAGHNVLVIRAKTGLNYYVDEENGIQGRVCRSG